MHKLSALLRDICIILLGVFVNHPTDQIEFSAKDKGLRLTLTLQSQAELDKLESAKRLHTIEIRLKLTVVDYKNSLLRSQS